MDVWHDASDAGLACPCQGTRPQDLDVDVNPLMEGMHIDQKVSRHAVVNAKNVFLFLVHFRFSLTFLLLLPPIPSFVLAPDGSYVSTR